MHIIKDRQEFKDYICKNYLDFNSRNKDYEEYVDYISCNLYDNTLVVYEKMYENPFDKYYRKIVLPENNNSFILEKLSVTMLSINFEIVHNSNVDIVKGITLFNKSEINKAFLDEKLLSRWVSFKVKNINNKKVVCCDPAAHPYDYTVIDEAAYLPSSFNNIYNLSSIVHQFKNNKVVMICSQ